MLNTAGDDRPVRGGAIVRAFHAGLEALAGEADVVANLDADVSFEPDFFARLLAAFAGDPRLGIASVAVPFLVDDAGVRRRGPMRDAARSEKRDALLLRVAGTPQGATELVGPVQRRQGRALTIDVHRNHRDVVVRRHEVQRHHDAVIELPLLGIGEIELVQHR